MGSNDEALNQAIEVIEREIERLEQLKVKLEAQVSGKSQGQFETEAAAPASSVAEAQPKTSMLQAGQLLVPLHDGTGKRIPQKERIIRILKLRGPLTRSEIIALLQEISKHTLNSYLSDYNTFYREHHRWYLQEWRKQASQESGNSAESGRTPPAPSGEWTPSNETA